MGRGFRVPTHLLVCLVAVFVLNLFPLAGETAAQVGATASIVGQVTDESKGVLPGVTVTATSPALQVPQVVAVTDERGEYRLTTLPIGDYTVEWGLSGFQSVRREGVQLTARFTAKLDVVLKVGSLTETVTVSGATPVVDVASTAVTTHVTRDVLDSIPTGRNAYTSLLELAPGARGNIDVGGSTNNGTPAFSNFGMNEESWQAVEGVSTKTPNISDSGNFPDFTTMEEAAISTLAHDASVPSRGVVINTVIKSGGDDYHGMLFYGGTNNALESNPANGGSLLYRDDTNVQLGGPIMAKKIWFFAGARYQRQERYVINSPNAVGAVCLKPDGSQCVTENKSPFFTPKVTYQITPNQRLIGMTWLNERIDTAIANGGLVQWSDRRNWGGFDGVYKAEYQIVKGSSLVMSLLAGEFWNHSGTKCVDETCSMVYRTDKSTRVTSGLNSRAGERNVEERWQIRPTLSWYRPNWAGGNHEIKVGADYFHVPANRLQRDRGAAKNYLLIFRNGVSDSIQMLNAPIYPDNAGKYLSLYVEDTWVIGRKLTLNLGARYAYDSIYENAGCRAEAAPAPANLAFPATCWEKTQMPLFKSLVPRLGAAYDITGDGKTMLKAGWNRYVRMRLFDHLQPMANNVISTAIYTWRDLNGNKDYDPGEVNLNPNGPDFQSLTLSGTFSSGARGVVNPNEQQPHTDEYSLQFERQLVSNLAARLTLLHARVSNVPRLGSVLRPYSAYNIPINSPDPGPDGKVGTADDTGNVITWYDYPASLAGVANQTVTYVNDPKAIERYSAMEVSVSKRLSNNWQLQAAYTATKKHIPLSPNADTFSTQDPNAEIFSVNDTWEWLSRISGSYLFKHGILASARFESRSGTPWARQAILTGGKQIPNITVNVEPIGSERLPTVSLLDVRLEKQIRLAEGRVMHVRANLANVFNNLVATAVTTTSGPSFGVLTGQVLPRVLNFEIEFRF